MNIREQVIVVTGASSGIGAALARRLGKEGARMVLAARRADALHATAREADPTGLRVLAVQADVSVRDQAEAVISAALEAFGRIDVLVNNAGRGHLASVEETGDDVIASIFGVNVFALWHTTRPALRAMRRQGSGHIINMASLAGKVGYPYNSAYVAAKHACVGFTFALRAELAGSGIEATVVCPAGVLTDWASVTEGGPMLPLLSAAGPVVKRLAVAMGIPLPEIEGAVSPERVAEDVLGCILHPVPELFTHRGSREFAVLAATNRLEAERRQLPVTLGEREVYRGTPRP
jgi:short-subunit dehydrogenase